MATPAPGIVTVWSDLACPWSHVAVARLHRVREELGLVGKVRLDHRAFALEVVNRQPTPRPVFDAEVPVAGALEPGAGWQLWQGPAATFPVTTVLAMEAVQAAKEQSPEASEALDRALRRAMFAHSRCISIRSVILEVAEECAAVDAGALGAALDDGRARRSLMDDVAEAEGDSVQGSPHLFLPDGTDVHNPGIEMHWEGDKGRGFPVVDSDRPDVYVGLLRAAAAA